jgi:hypothetical protein
VRTTDNLVVVPGERPLVLVAPHGGRRDARRRPWAGGRLRMNDLHTAELTAELAALTGAAALINATHDRNDVDLNRIHDADARAPWFLERLAALVDAAVARHGRATVVFLHGWNVVQPVVDVGLGCAPGDDPLAVGPRAAVTPAFATTTLSRLLAGCAACGIGATVGARYPARNAENLVQLFTTRHRDDRRARVAALVRRAADVDAVQLELGIPLRWPGPWRARFVAAARDALATSAECEPPPAPTRGSAPADAVPLRLEFAGSTLSGLVGIDRGRGGRLLLFPRGGGLALFTGERIGLEPAATAARLDVGVAPDGARTVRYRGPLLAFPDTTPFLDLEEGLARARLVDADVALAFTPRDACCAPAGFGFAEGRVELDGVTEAIDARAFAEDGAVAGPWPRVRTALHLAADAALTVTVGLDGGSASGFFCGADGADGHVAVSAARVVLGSAGAPADRVALEVELVDGRRLRITTHAVHRLPVVRNAGGTPLRLEFVACRLDGDGAESSAPAGWLEAGGLPAA